MKNNTHDDSLDKKRHTAAHLLATAVLELYPDAQLGIGPTIEHGFYYDILFSEAKPFQQEDLKALEKRMKKLIQANLPMTGRTVSYEEAQTALSAMGQGAQQFKEELLADLQKDKQEVSLYTIGEFTDLCRGGHTESSGELNADGLKLQNTAGAYWKGSEKNPMLTRIYGLLFHNREELDAHLQLLEEAKKRDHRKIGQDMELFCFDDMVGKGLPLWLPNGTILRNAIETLAVETEDRYDYERVVTPHIGKQQLFEQSGHLPYYADSMYPGMEMDDGTYFMKPMNCPFHHVMYNSRPRSYRELPVRYAEYSTVYRNELSGALAGLLRVRGMHMNDAHMYVRRDQIQEEISKVIAMNKEYFELFGLTDYWFRLSKWDPEHTEKYLNEPESWEFAEAELRAALEQSGVPFTEVSDEAAFYGPKIDVQFRSVIGREETMSTIQLDFAAKQRFDLSFTDSSGTKSNDVYVIHRAPLSTHERFIAFMIEHFAGNFPLWLAPVQVQLISVGESHRTFVNELAYELKRSGLRVAVDNTDESVGKKIRNSTKQKIPYILVIGDKEMESANLMVRKRGEEEAVEVSKEAFVARCLELATQRSQDL